MTAGAGRRRFEDATTVKEVPNCRDGGERGRKTARCFTCDARGWEWGSHGALSISKDTVMRVFTIEHVTYLVPLEPT